MAVDAGEGVGREGRWGGVGRGALGRCREGGAFGRKVSWCSCYGNQRGGFSKN